jgi:SNF2 family DNA or RNA helicase
MVIPVMRYGDVEIPVRTKRNIYATDDRGKEFIVNRDDEAEAIFTAMVMRQHPFFEEQMDNDLHYFYLHRERFLAEDWFLDTFEEWRQAGVIVLGFDELEGNKLNPYKVKIDIKVQSGINWFNAVVEARFGARKASLKQLQKAVRSKNKYVQLDDGSLGILPVEWLEKFADYFNAGEISDEDLLQIPKVNFAAIEAFCREDEIDSAVKSELALYRERFRDFKAIADVAVPAGLRATLRPYQKEGLNWLNFLDNFNFGGCLADDMGLGKSVQIIAFILSQRTKAKHNTNLLVVPRHAYL